MWMFALLLACSPSAGVDAPAPDGMLRALGYVDDAPPASDCGVEVLDRERMAPGPTLITNWDGAHVALLAPNGSAIADWTVPDVQDHAVYAAPLPDGALGVLDGAGRVHVLEHDGTLRWSQQVYGHHGFDVDARGRLRVLTAALGPLQGPSGVMTVLHDRVTVLAVETGAVGPSIDVTEALAPYLPEHLLAAAAEAPTPTSLSSGTLPTKRDLLHVNSIEVLTRPLGTQCLAGDLLVFPRNLGEPSCLNPEGRLRWRSRVGMRGAHDVQRGPQGRILMFDNRPGQLHSRIVALTPGSTTAQTVYDPPDAPFFSRVLGRVQPLPHGGWLVVSGRPGEIREVNRRGELLWHLQKCGEAPAIHHARRLEPGVARRLIGHR